MMIRAVHNAVLYMMLLSFANQLLELSGLVDVYML